MTLLRVELAADEVRIRTPTAAAPDDSRPKVALEAVPCAADAAEARLTLSFGAAPLTRTVDLRGVDPVAQPRALAIAMAALLREGLLAPAPGSPPAPAGPAPWLGPEATSLPAIGFTVAAESRFFASGNGLFGGRVGVHAALLPWLLVLGDLGVLRATAHDPLGDVDVTVLSLGLGALATGHVGGLTLGVGPRVELGPGWFEGEPASATVQSVRTSSPLAFGAISAVASFRVHDPVQGFVAVDAGETVYGFQPKADDRYAGAVSGALVGVRAGLGWGLGRPVR